MNFSERSYKKELLDRDDIPFEDIRRNMAELEFINAHLGGHKITIDGIRRICSERIAAGKRSWHICEIGCGGGDNLVAIGDWFRKLNLSVRFTGVDINPDCITVADRRLRSADVTLITSDYSLVNFEGREPDIIFSSLFCHHFTDEELVNMLRWMKTSSGVGFFINDLQRHPLAYYSIDLLAYLFSSSYLVKNDAPLSVLRGFTRKEWQRLLQKADISDYSIVWKWAFRFLITVNK